MNLFVLLLLFTVGSFAEEYRPASFQTTGGKAVFTDFQTANYEMVIDAKTHQVKIRATIDFDMPESGLPVFDSWKAPSHISLDGAPVTQKAVKTADSASTVRAVQREIPAGHHRMVIDIPPQEEMKTGTPGRTNIFMNLSDQETRGYLEYWLPSNLQYDRVKMNIDVKVVNAADEHRPFTNGTETRLGPNHYRIEYPDYFTSLSPYFQIASNKLIGTADREYTSMDGRKIPIHGLYPRNSDGGSAALLREVVEASTNILHELEGSYGPYPHDELLVYADEGREGPGMEYCGAASSSLSALRHEILHQWFGRSVMPANSRAEWIDEAVVTWIDQGEQRQTSVNDCKPEALSTVPEFSRMVPDSAYVQGACFIGYLDGLLADKGGIKPFLREFATSHRHGLVTNETFISDINAFYHVDLTDEFRKYTQALPQ